MKLVDILARELKVWPAGAIDLKQRDLGGVWCSSLDFCIGRFRLSSDWTEAVVTRAEWQAAVDALNADKCEHSYANKIGCPECGELNSPKVVEWEQGDIPNAGDQCEAYVLAETEKQGRPMNRWISGKFIAKALSDNGGIALLVECDDGWIHVINAFSYLRHPRAPEQVAAEEREKAIKDLYYTINWDDDPKYWDDAVSVARKTDYAKAIDAGYTRVAK